MNPTGMKWLSAGRGVLLIIAVAALTPIGLRGQPYEKHPDVALGEGETIIVYTRQSRVIRAPWPVARVSVTDPKVADVKMLTPTEILLQGKALGSTDLIMWSKDEQTRKMRVDVDVDLRRMKAELTRLFPNSRLDVSQSQDVIVVTGMLARAEHAGQLRDFLNASQLKYVDMTSVAGVQQVQLQVRIAEVSRIALRTLGINAFVTGSDFFGASMVGSSRGGPVNPISIGPPVGATATVSKIPFRFTSGVNVASSVTLFAGFPSAGLEFFIQALAENQYLRVLAEPNLVALSGEEAEFLAGGEFPVPVVQGSTAGGGTTLTIEWKDFGVRLRFRPTVLGDGTIRLYVAPEVSELSDVGAVLIEGFRIPSVLSRRAETTLELKNGQTFAMAGLIRRTNNATSSRVPVLGDLPILGVLFRSVRYEKNDTELVVLVTASLVAPMSLGEEPPVPGLTHVPPNDWDLYAMGRIEGKPARLSPAQSDWLKKMSLGRLRGPGAWVAYDSKYTRSTVGQSSSWNDERDARRATGPIGTQNETRTIAPGPAETESETSEAEPEESNLPMPDPASRENETEIPADLSQETQTVGSEGESVETENQTPPPSSAGREVEVPPTAPQASEAETSEAKQNENGTEIPETASEENQTGATEVEDKTEVPETGPEI